MAWLVGTYSNHYRPIMVMA